MLYLDYSANTPVDEAVLQCFCEAERRYPGNANAHHQAGTDAKAAINEATRSIARCLGAPPAGIIYTSGASEANNLAVKGLAALGRAAGRHILSTPLEHSSVSGSLEALQKQGYEVELLNICSDGTVDLADLKNRLRPDTVLVAVTAVDSELGVVQPIAEIAELLKAYPNCHFHVDATQAVGKIPIQFEGVDTMSLTATNSMVSTASACCSNGGIWRWSLSSTAERAPPFTAAAPRRWLWPPRWRWHWSWPWSSCRSTPRPSKRPMHSSAPSWPSIPKSASTARRTPSPTS